jgi:uncharacterized damage-inducible protein DinB
MFRQIADFEKSWQADSESMLKVLRTLTDASLGQAVVPGGRTLGRLAWHLTCTLGEMPGRVGLTVDSPRYEAEPPASAAAIAAAYEKASRSLLEQLRSQGWSDATLEIEDDMYGQRWKRGFTLTALLEHQVHHRGQMTVLMRQAGLRVPGIYGPAREDWASMGMKAEP